MSQKPIRLSLSGQTIEAISVAGLETCIQLPGLDLCFDIGRCPPSAVNRRTVLFTHSHIDHMGGGMQQPDLYSTNPPQHILPATIEDSVHHMLMHGEN